MSSLRLRLGFFPGEILEGGGRHLQNRLGAGPFASPFYRHRPLPLPLISEEGTS